MTDQPARKPSHSVDPLFVGRWSPRAFAPESLPQKTVETVLEAARWSPSAYNSQPWRIHYAHREDDSWATYLNLLLPGNQEWAQDGSVLFALFSQPRFYFAPAKKEMDCPTASFDCGAAWMAMALQATKLNLHLHAMVGFDMERANAVLGVDPAFKPEAMMVLGRRTDADKLSPSLQRREMPSPRFEIADFSVRGGAEAAD